MARDHLPPLDAKAAGRAGLRAATQVDAGVAVVVLDEQGKPQGLGGPLEIVVVASRHRGGRGDAAGATRLLHPFPSGLVGVRDGPDEGHVGPLEDLDDLDARQFGLIRGAVAEVEEEVEAIVGDESLDRRKAFLLPGEGHEMPLGVGKERPRIAGPVVFGEALRVQILRGQQADAKTLGRVGHRRTISGDRPIGRRRCVAMLGSVGKRKEIE